MKIRVFKEFNETNLEDVINQWLIDNPVIIRDLKVSVVSYEKMGRRLICYVVIILYTKERGERFDTRYS